MIKCMSLENLLLFDDSSYMNKHLQRRNLENAKINTKHHGRYCSLLCTQQEHLKLQCLQPKNDQHFSTGWTLIDFRALSIRISE